MSKRNKHKEKKRKETQPLVLLSPKDIDALAHILYGYIGYLRNHRHILPLAQQKIPVLEDLRARILTLYLGLDGGTTPISQEDMQALREAMIDFVALIKNLAPSSP